MAYRNLKTGFQGRFQGKEAVAAMLAGQLEVTTELMLPAKDALTAHAGGGQTNAIQLGYGISHITVVATANDSAALPQAFAGDMVVVVNDGAAPAKLFAMNGTTDTIDGTAGSTGVPLANGHRAFFFAPANGEWVSRDANGVVFPAADALTAHAGGGQANAIQLGYGINRLSVVATANDSVALPQAFAGDLVVVINDGVAAAKIYAKNGTTDTIDGVAGATGVPLTNGNRALFVSPANGEWVSLAGVASS